MDGFLAFNSTTRARLLNLLSPVLVLAIVLLAAVLRFHEIGRQSLWNDEGNTLRLVERPIPSLLENASHDIHPPGYYLALKAWWSLTGESEFALRAFSALAGLLTVACVYALGRALSAPGAGALAALLVAVNAFSVYYGQEARMYALLALCAAASMLIFARWTARPAWKTALALALINAAGLYTQYTYPAVMLTQGVMFIAWWLGRPNRRTLMMYFGLNVLMILLFVPQLSTALTQIGMWPRTGHATDAGTGLATVAQWLVYGNTANRLPWTSYLWPGLFMLASFLPDWLRNPQPGWWRRILPLLWLLITVVPFFALGLFRDANLKFLLTVQIAVAIMIGRGAWLLWEIGSPNLFIFLEALPRLLAVAGVFSILSFSNDALNNLYDNPAFARSDYRAMSKAILADERPGDAIVLDAPNQWEVFTYYYHGSDPIFPLPEGLGGDDPKTIASVNKVIDANRRIFVLYWGESERDPNRVVEKTLTDRAFEASSAWSGDVRFVEYATLPQSAGIDTGITAKFGESIALESATISAASVRIGDVIGVKLAWKTDKPIAIRYKVFVQLLDSSGKLVAQHDGEPGNNMALTTTWQPGTTIQDAHGLLVPLNLPAGDYTLIAGLYDMNNPQNRLPVGPSDHVDLGTIHVSP